MTPTKQDVFNIVEKSLIDAGFKVIGGGSSFTVFERPNTKLFFNTYGDLVLRKLAHWGDSFEDTEGE
jgi:hypothetical protein